MALCKAFDATTRGGGGVEGWGGVSLAVLVVDHSGGGVGCVVSGFGDGPLRGVGLLVILVVDHSGGGSLAGLVMDHSRRGGVGGKVGWWWRSDGWSRFPREVG